MQKDFYYSEPNQVEAIRILKDHANSIDTGKYRILFLWNCVVTASLIKLPQNFKSYFSVISTILKFMLCEVC